MADRTLIPATEAQAQQWRRTGTIALCQCGAMEDETRPCPCPEACECPEPGGDRIDRAAILIVFFVGLILSVAFWLGIAKLAGAV